MTYKGVCTNEMKSRPCIIRQTRNLKRYILSDKHYGSKQNGLDVLLSKMRAENKYVVWASDETETAAEEAKDKRSLERL